MIDILRHIFRKKKSTNVEENLRKYISISDTIVSAGLFSVIFSAKLDVTTYFGTDDTFAIARGVTNPDFWNRLTFFLQEKWLLLLLAVFVFAWFILYKRAVKNEMEILVTLYSRFNPPHDWERTLGQKWIPALSVGITVAFLALAYFIDRIAPFCAIMLCLNVLDARGNNVIRQNLARHFRDPKYVPLETDIHKKFIMQRREAAENYWIRKPQIERVGVMMIGVVVAFMAAFSEQIFGFALWEWVPVAVIIFTIAANEYTMGKWRVERDRELERIDAEQEEEDRRRTEG